MKYEIYILCKLNLGIRDKLLNVYIEFSEFLSIKLSIKSNQNQTKLKSNLNIE